MGDGGFGDHDSGGVDAEVVVAGNHARESVHQNAIAMLGYDVEDHDPPLAGEIAGPVVVRDDDLMVFGVAAGRDKRAAISRSGQPGRLR